MKASGFPLLLLLLSRSDVRPHRWQPTRLRCPWDSLGKNTGVGCHFLLQSGFPLGLHNFLQSLACGLKLIRYLYMSKVLPMNLLKNEALL